MPIAHLSNRTLFSVTGPDAVPFLQGQLTSDIATLAPGRPLYAGYLSPQGKTLFALFLSAGEDGGIIIDCDAQQAEALQKRLTMFKLRRMVAIQTIPLAVFALWDEPGSHPPDPRLSAAGQRWIAEAGSVTVTATLEDWHAHRLPLGLPEAEELGSDELLWLETNARSLNGVSFTKGCYVGQENTARMHHRDKVRKLLLGMKLPTPMLGTRIMAGSKEAGSLRGHPHACMQMALLRTEYLDEPLSVDGIPVEVIRPDWLAGA